MPLFGSMSEMVNEFEGGVLLLTMIEAARVLSIGRTTMYELVGAGDIEVVHIGRSARVPVAAVEEFVEQRRAERATVRPSRRAARAEREPGPGQPTT
jgi:excisionase family DNA binding protein